MSEAPIDRESVGRLAQEFHDCDELPSTLVSLCDRIEELEAELAKAVGALKHIEHYDIHAPTHARNINTGYWNTGYWNTGNCNIGNYNTGNYNTGDWNKGDLHIGCFNTIDAKKAYYFNKLIDKAEWDVAIKPMWLYEPLPTTWVLSEHMTEQEKVDHPSHEATGGYLRINDIKEEWRKAYESASEEDIQAVRDLPAFDYDVFEEITGLDLRIKDAAPCEGREVEIDGVVYVLKAKGGEDE